MRWSPDVRRYPEFLPWCLAARIRHTDERALTADLIIGFRMFRERFTSFVELDPDTLSINVRYAEGPFKVSDEYMAVPAA
jgi:coenzyme Q-binding protein COQ10